jgi:glycerol-3-phosphate acyltransferase PlsY
VDVTSSSCAWLVLLGTFVGAYLMGSIPFAYLIVRGVTGEDVTKHGTGNVGSMNVRRTTGSWGWFALAVIGDGMKGLVPTLIAKAWSLGVPVLSLAAFKPWGLTLVTINANWWQQPLLWVPMAAVAGSVLGHNYSIWMALIEHRFARTGKGLATGAGALLAYDWRYFVAVVVVGLAVIALTRYMMAGQVAAAVTLPVAAILLGSPDFAFVLVMGIVVYAAHHKRFIGLLAGREPKLYINDGSGPRG